MRKLKAQYIPFVRTQGERDIVNTIMIDADIVRVTADFADAYKVGPTWRLWIDPGFDGYEFVFSNGWYNSDWHDWIRQFDGHELLISDNAASTEDPDGSEGTNTRASQSDINDFVARVLDSIAEHNPTLISVPQLPYTPGSARHGINRKLAKATGKWKEKNWASGSLILPVILNHQDTYRIRKASVPKINAICRSLELSRATGTWIVHRDFDDLAGRVGYDHDAFPSLIEFHEQLNESLPAKTFTCAGPYWAINLILWARGIIDIPVIGCGGVYRYYLPKPPQVIGKAISRIAIPPIKRWYGVNRELQTWITTAKNKFPPKNEVRESLAKIESDFGQFLGPGGRAPAMKQTAQFYDEWLRNIAAIQPKGRGLYLFQEFSRAVVNGSHIGTKLPKLGQLSSGARDPGSIAQQFMLQCLPR